jgi:hypothetical protein
VTPGDALHRLARIAAERNLAIIPEAREIVGQLIARGFALSDVDDAGVLQLEHPAGAIEVVLIGALALRGESALCAAARAAIAGNPDPVELGEPTALKTDAGPRSWPPPRAWLDLAAILDEHDDLVAVRVGPAGTRGRDAHGITHELKLFDPDAIALLIAFLDARSVEDGARGAAPVTRFASPSLTYEVFGPSDVQIHRWRSAPSWRSALGPS